MKYNAVLWDLDGTLVDTSPDLSAALNHVLNINHQPSLLLTNIRRVCSDGVAGLLKLGFNIDRSHENFNFLSRQLLEYYHTHIADQSCLFEGIDLLLKKIEAQKIPWGIVTNKPHYLTEELLYKLNLTHRASCVVSGDTLSERKPHPAPLLYAAKSLEINPDQCCYIGDAERDIIAANQAGMFSIAALYGFLNKDAEPELWKAKAIVHAVENLDDILGL